MNINTFSVFTDMSFYLHQELSSTRRPHRSPFTGNCQQCTTVCGYQRRSNHNILCAACYHQLPSNFMRISYKFIYTHHNSNITNKPTNCYICSRNLVFITQSSKCYLCLQLHTTIYSLHELYHERR